MARIVFMGTPQAAVPTLRRIVEDGHEVVAVWTQPDRPSGPRGNKISFLPVKEFALANGLNVYQPARIKNDEAKQLFASHNADIAVVVAYGRILPDEFLRAPRRGCINSGAVSFSPIGVLRCRRIGPVSSVGSMNIVVTPVSVSPLTTAQLAGAAPRYSGSREK